MAYVTLFDDSITDHTPCVPHFVVTEGGDILLEIYDETGDTMVRVEINHAELFSLVREGSAETQQIRQSAAAIMRAE